MENKKRILVVDDEADLVTFVKLRLEANGYEVLAAVDGEEARKAAKESQPDLIILDIILPKLNGFEVCSLLKNDPKTSHIPIIMLTAKDQEADIHLAKKVGSDAYIAKPFDADMLLLRIKELLKEI